MIREISLMTPKGILLNLELLDIQKEENAVTCAVQKDAGDDPDTTNGILVYATVEKLDAKPLSPGLSLTERRCRKSDKAGTETGSRRGCYQSGSKSHDPQICGGGRRQI